MLDWLIILKTFKITKSITSKKGSFKIEEVKKEIRLKLNQKNIYNKSNEKIINNYFDDLLISKKLFKYEDNSDEYFYIH